MSKETKTTRANIQVGNDNWQPTLEDLKHLEQQLKIAKDIMREDRDLLHELGKH
jgi:hypothetical protein